MVTRLRELEALEDELTERLGQAPADLPDIHPNVAGIYRRKVERLAEALRRPEERDEAAEAIRGVIERITLTPGPGAARSTRRCTASSARSWNGRHAPAGRTKPTLPLRERREQSER